MAPRITVPRVLGATAIYLGATYASYKYLKSTYISIPVSSDSEHPSFDRLATCYDKKVGTEETFIGYGLLRWWMLRSVQVVLALVQSGSVQHIFKPCRVTFQGDVLEISAGTGRNLKYYNYGQIISLTLSDLSVAMLSEAETKYYEDLKVPFKHPSHMVAFIVADAHCLCQEGVSSTDTIHNTCTSSPPPTLKPTIPAPSAKDLQAQAEQKAEDIAEVVAHSRSRPSPDVQSQQALKQSSTTAAEPHQDAGPTDDKRSQQQDSFATRFLRQFWKASQLDPDTKPSASRPAAMQPAGTSAPLADHAESRSGGCCSCSFTPEAAAESSYRERCGGSGRGLHRFAEHSFDTIVDTFGLCSHEDPVVVLKEVARLCKPGGRIILLEHGRGSWSWLNGVLDDSAEKHYRKWGCWWNRDILKLVEQAGLKVESTWRWHFGTTYMIWATPAPP